MELKKELSSTYTRLVNKSLDSKQLTYWEQSILNNAASMDSFKKNILNSEEYYKHIFQLFQTAIDDIFKEHRLNGQEIFDGFWAKFKNTEIVDETCKTYIYDLPIFQNYIENMIADIYLIEHSRTPSIEESQYFVDKFRQNSGYNVQNLMSDIKIQNRVFKQQQQFDTAIIDDFENVFNRSMYIQEYFKYINTDTSLNWEEIRESHFFKFNSLKTIFINYTGKSISEYYFVKKYLVKADDQHFLEDIVKDIVESDEYKSGMQKVIDEKFKKLYDQTLNVTDIEYIYAIIKAKKLPIVSEDIDIILQQFKHETDEITSQIFKIFMDILQRPPDMSEIEYYVSYYRERKDSEVITTTNLSVEKILISTLEFHDIIKKHIKSCYSEKFQKDILHSVMYDVLNKILKNIDNITMKNLDEQIINYF